MNPRTYGPMADAPTMGMQSAKQEIAANPPGLIQKQNIASNHISRAGEFADMILECIGGPIPKSDCKPPPSSCLMSVATSTAEEAELLCKKLETVLQMLGR